jgi:hypothetical protein
MKITSKVKVACDECPNVTKLELLETLVSVVEDDDRFRRTVRAVIGVDRGGDGWRVVQEHPHAAEQTICPACYGHMAGMRRDRFSNDVPLNTTFRA